MNNFIKSILHEPIRPVSIERLDNDVIVIEGVQYAGNYFREFGYPDTDMLYAVRRDGDNVWLTQIRNMDEAKEFFDSLPALPQIGEHDLGEEDQEQGDEDGL